jgi:hypothetical protein
MKRGPRYRIRNPAELVERQSARGWWSRLPDGSMALDNPCAARGRRCSSSLGFFRSLSMA